MIIKQWKIFQDTWHELQYNAIIAWCNRIIFILYGISVFMIFWRLPHLPALVPLWYSRPWGVDQLAHPYWLFLLPAGGLIWHGVNVIVNAYIHREYLTFIQLLFLSSLLVSMLSIFTLIKIVTIVG